MNFDSVDGFLGGNVAVMSTSGRGFTPEELAEMALDKIVYVGSKSHPVIREQAEAFKNNLRVVLIQYLLCVKFIKDFFKKILFPFFFFFTNESVRKSTN